MLTVICLVFFACGKKDKENSLVEHKVNKKVVEQQDTRQLSEEENTMAFNKATELAEVAKKEVEHRNENKALELFNEALKIKQIPWIFADRGKLKINMNDGEGALLDLTKAINDEKRGIYYIWRAEAYRMLGNDELADADIKEAEKLPKDY